MEETLPTCWLKRTRALMASHTGRARQAALRPGLRRRGKPGVTEQGEPLWMLLSPQLQPDVDT